MKAQGKGLALLAITLTAIMWGFSFISIKVTLTALPPMTQALLRFILASVLLMVTLKVAEPGAKLKIKDYPQMALAGLTGVTAYFFFENNGVKLLTASAASITIAATPILTLVADAMFFHNRLTARKITSVLISVVGVYLVVGADYRELLASGQGLGYLAMLGAGCAWVAYCMTTRNLNNKYSMLTITAYLSVFGAVTTLPFALFETTSWHLVNGSVLFNLAFLGVFCSALGYYLYAYAMSKLGVGITSLFINLIPVVTVVASFFILGERVTMPMIYGGLLVVGAVMLLSWPGTEEADLVGVGQQNAGQSSVQ
ncbi:MAG TPA: DMT family transporter [Bacillota bacterium]|nr:DMT family transporter [Bacillota bacterium]